MVDLVWPHIKFINIRPLEGGIRVFICILWRISRFLTTRSAKRPTYHNMVHSRTKIFFASYSTGLELSFESGSRIFLQFLKNTAQEQPSAVGPCIPILKFGPIQRSVDLCIPLWKFWSIQRSVDLYIPLLKFWPINRSVDPYTPLLKLGPINRSVDP